MARNNAKLKAGNQTLSLGRLRPVTLLIDTSPTQTSNFEGVEGFNLLYSTAI